MSPVNSVESWFFSSLGWKVPMPMRSFSDSSSRYTLTSLASICTQSPSYLASRAVQQQDAPLGAVALGRRLEGVDQLHQRPLQAVDRVAVLARVVGEEAVADDLVLVLVHLLGAVGQDHVVEALVGAARHLRV